MPSSTSPPMTEIDDKTTTINLTFDIAKGSEVYFNRINIMGNEKTKENVIRREIRFGEGDLYSSTKMKLDQEEAPKQHLLQVGELKTIKTDDPDRINLDVIVEEKPTGTLSLGVGYSTYEKAFLPAV